MTYPHKWIVYLMGLGFWTIGVMALALVWFTDDASMDAGNFFGLGIFMFGGFWLGASSFLTSIKERK